MREGSKAGTFVEIKNSDVGAGTKVPHLSYIGDADDRRGHEPRRSDDHRQLRRLPQAPHDDRRPRQDRRRHDAGRLRSTARRRRLHRRRLGDHLRRPGRRARRRARPAVEPPGLRPAPRRAGRRRAIRPPGGVVSETEYASDGRTLTAEMEVVETHTGRTVMRRDYDKRLMLVTGRANPTLAGRRSPTSSGSSSPRPTAGRSPTARSTAASRSRCAAPTSSSSSRRAATTPRG